MRPSDQQLRVSSATALVGVRVGFASVDGLRYDNGPQLALLKLLSSSPTFTSFHTVGLVEREVMLLEGRAIGNDVDGQWRNPNDILSLLLLLSPDIIQRAFAQLVGGPLAPVAFSFGWVAYSVNALLSVFGGMWESPSIHARGSQ